jgi:hypothetical protein
VGFMSKSSAAPCVHPGRPVAALTPTPLPGPPLDASTELRVTQQVLVKTPVGLRTYRASGRPVRPRALHLGRTWIRFTIMGVPPPGQ